MKITSIFFTLFLFFSCSKNGSYTKMEGEIANHVQDQTINQYLIGSSKYYQFEELASDKSVSDIAKLRYKQMNKRAQLIDKEVGKRIFFIEQLRAELVQSLKINIHSEDISKVKWRERKNLLSTSWFDFNQLNLNGTTNELSNNSMNAKELFSTVKRLNEKLVEISCNYKYSDQYYYFKVNALKSFKNLKDFELKFEKDKKISNLSIDDEYLVRELLLSFSDLEIKTALNSDTRIISIMNFLSVIEAAILEARSKCLNNILSQIGCNASYSFDRIIPLSVGSEIVKRGEISDFKVLMAAYDSSKVPIVTVTSGSANVKELKEGMAIVSFKSDQLGEQIVSGKISIINKSGIPKTVLWEKKIVVIE